jgi:hypothetical protein
MEEKLNPISGFCTYSYPLDQYSCMETAERRKRVVKKLVLSLSFCVVLLFNMDYPSFVSNMSPCCTGQGSVLAQL